MAPGERGAVVGALLVLAFYTDVCYAGREMEPGLRYRGRPITEVEIAAVRALIAAQPGLSRRALSQAVCAHWGWRQPNGVLRDGVCRGLLVQLHRAGQLTLPPARYVVQPQQRVHRPPTPITLDTTPVGGPLAALRPLEIRQVRRTPDETRCRSLLAQYHYLGAPHPVGEHLSYLVAAEDRPLGCLVWTSAPRHLGPRDRFIGWSPAARRRNLRCLAYNSRFLLLPWVTVPHLASHVLGRMARMLPHDWGAVYGHPVYFLETFVDPARARGTCYRAANWHVLGPTTGRGKNAPTQRPTRSVKLILGYPLTPRFRQLLAG